MVSPVKNPAETQQKTSMTGFCSYCGVEVTETEASTTHAEHTVIWKLPKGRGMDDE